METTTAISCPVCKKHLKVDEPLQDHLHTHPKQQVIEALIQLKVACKDNKPSGSVQGNNGNPLEKENQAESAGSDFSKIFRPSSPVSQNEERHEGDESQEEETVSQNERSTEALQSDFSKIFRAQTPPVYENRDKDKGTEEDLASSSNAVQYALPPCVPTASSTHLLQLPQFLAGATPVAQYIQVPVVTAAGQPTSAQAPVVLYSPFQSTSSCDQADQNQVLQLIASSNLMRPPYSIIQTRSSSEIPQSAPLTVQQSFSEIRTEGSTSHIIFMPTNSVVQQTSVAVNEDAQEGWSDTRQVYEAPMENLKQENSLSHQEDEGYNMELEENVVVQESEENCDAAEQENAQQQGYSSCQDLVLTSDTEVQSYSASGHLPESAKKEKAGGCSGLESPDVHVASEATVELSDSPSSGIAEGPVRVRSDLNNSDKRTIAWPVLRIIRVKKEVEQIDDNCAGTSPVLPSTSNLEMSDMRSAAQKVGSLEPSVVSNQQNVIVSCNGGIIQNSVNTMCGPVKGDKVLKGLVQNVNMPLTKEDVFQEDSSIGRPGTPCDSAPQSPYQKSLGSPSTPLNIQTDETMPPRGELSEQESMGGNSSSMWSVPAYHASREWPSPVVSYDLTARESWPGSDISDSEGGNATDSQPPQSVKPAPSFTNTLQPFLPKPSSESTFHGESSFSSHLQPLTFMESNENSKIPSMVVHDISQIASTPENNSIIKPKKAPAKPRVYRCKECSSEFSSLKLRRQHPCELEKNTSDNTTVNTTIAVMRMSTELQGLNDESLSVPGSSSREDDLSVQAKPKKKYTRKPKTVKKEVILDDQSSGQANFGENYQIGKQESEETMESRTSQMLSGVPPSQSQTNFEFTTLNKPLENTEAEDESMKTASVFSCQKCDTVLKTAKLLSQHMSSKHKALKYQCTTCEESFDNEPSYFDHLLIHPLECQLCGKTFKRRKYLSLHMKWHMETKPHKCETCGKSFVTKQKLDEHLNTHTGNAPIQCTDCDKSFKRYSNLIQHRNRHHLNVKPKTKDYVCHCGEILPTKKKLEWHKEIHDDKPKSCHYCSEKFLHTASLTRHIRRTHNESYVPRKEREAENIECPVCRVVILKSSLPTHMKIHSGERSFPCHICGKDFSTKWNLQLHRWTHASRSARPFKCTLCKASFVRKQDYFGHMHSHRNVRPYTCNHCGCQFVRKYNCYRHMREHEENKKFVCTICNKSFHRRYYLNDHMRVHSGTRPFTCHICGKASTSKSNHNKHVRIHHAREPQNTEI